MNISNPKSKIPATLWVPKSGFTLVELLVVITIIAILAGLISIAAVNAVHTAKQMRIKIEVDNLDLALKAFKAKYGDYPPCDLTSPATNTNLKSFLARAFPRYNQATIAADFTAAGVPSTFNPSTALVFWLRGFNPDVLHPFTDSVNASLPYTGTRTPFYDFDKTRLIDFSTNAVATEAALPGLLMYIPPTDARVPYVYYDYRFYKTFTPIPNWTFGTAGPCVPYALDVAENGKLDAAETFTDTAAPSPLANGTFDTGESYTDTNSNGKLDQGTDTWANKDTFQIISAGPDGIFGVSSTVVKLFPRGNGYDIAGSDNDNVTNFSSKSSLEDSRP